MAEIDANLFDSKLQRIGWGKYQVRNTISALTAATILGAHVLSPIFINYPLKYQCVYDQTAENNEKALNSSSSYSYSLEVLSNLSEVDECHHYTCKQNSIGCWVNVTSVKDLQAKECNSFRFLRDPKVETSIVKDFQLICNQASLTYILQSVFMLGVLLNGLIFGKLSDRIGRRKVVLFMAMLSLVLSVVISTVNSIEAYVILRGLIGFFCFTYPTICVLTTETTPPSYRSFFVLVQGAGFSVGIALLVLLAYFIKTWRMLQVALSIFFCVTVLLCWYYDESPRWLISRGKLKEAEAILRKISKVNKKQKRAETEMKKSGFDEDDISNEDNLISDKLVEDRNTNLKLNVKVENLGMSDTMRYKKMRLATFVITYSWFATSCVYYGLSLNVSKIGGDVYINALVMGVAGVVAAGIAIYLLKLIGRRTLIASNFLLAGIFCIIISILPEGSGWFKTLCFHFGRLLTMVPFEALYLYTIEVYPTVLRSTAVNFGSSFARAGAVVAGLVAMLHLAYPALPYFIYGFFALLAGVLNLLLSETKNHSMSDTMMQAEEFIRQNPGPLVQVCSRQRRL